MRDKPISFVFFQAIMLDSVIKRQKFFDFRSSKSFMHTKMPRMAFLFLKLMLTTFEDFAEVRNCVI